MQYSFLVLLSSRFNFIIFKLKIADSQRQKNLIFFFNSLNPGNLQLNLKINILYLNIDNFDYVLTYYVSIPASRNHIEEAN